MTKEVFLMSLFTELNTNKVDYFVYGAYKSLPIDTNGSDIDMVVAEKDICIFEKVLKAISIINNVFLASFYTNSTTKFYRFITTKWGVQIDVFYKELSYRGVPYFPTEKLRRDIILHNNLVYVLNEKKGFYVDYFKEIIHNGKVKEKYALALLNALVDRRDEVIQEITELYGKKAGQIIENNDTLDGLQKIGKALKHQMRNHILTNHLGTVLIDRVQSFSRLFMPRPGYVIVVEGTDGSGKSTIINYISPILNECFHKYVFYSHLRPKAIPDLGVILGKKSADEPEHVNNDPHGQSQSGFLGSLIRWGYYMIDYTFGYLKKVWIQIHSKSKVFIFDRYYYDYYIDQKRSRTNLPNWILRFGEMLIAKPDLILCLGGDPEKIYARKPETSLQEVERQTNALRHFCETHHNAVWIDTTTTIEQSCDDAMQAIVSMMSKRFN